MVLDDLIEGDVDFDNMARVAGITVSPGPLASESSALVQRADGGFGYPAALSPVPEPAAWCGAGDSKLPPSDADYS